MEPEELSAFRFCIDVDTMPLHAEIFFPAVFFYFYYINKSICLGTFRGIQIVYRHIEDKTQHF